MTDKREKGITTQPPGGGEAGNSHPWRKPRPSSSDAKGYGRRCPQLAARPPQCYGGRATEDGSV